MTWALRSQDSTFTTFLADKLLNLYCESGTFSSGDLLDHLGKILMILGPFLTIEYFCLITEINTAPAGSSFQGHYEKGL